MALQQQLNSFANEIREAQPTSSETPDVRRRMNIYRSLFFNNVVGFIESGFPVLHSLYSDEQWHALIRRFFAEHECTSPYFIHISKEFVEYLDNEYEPLACDPPFMTELAHYEWLELALSVRETPQDLTLWRDDNMPERLMASPLIELVAYHYPVHQISRDFQPEASDTLYYYLLHRDEQHEVQFQLITPLSALAIQLLTQQAHSVDSLVQAIRSQASDFPLETLYQGLTPLLSEWLASGALIPAQPD